MDIELLKNQFDWCHMDFHEHLRQLREAKKLTQEQVAGLLGIAKTTYIGYEKGDREPRLSELRKMASVFNMTLSQLCMEADSRNVDEGLVLTFEAVKQFDAKELAVFNNVVEAMVIRHHAQAATKLVPEDKKSHP